MRADRRKKKNRIILPVTVLVIVGAIILIPLFSGGDKTGPEVTDVPEPPAPVTEIVTREILCVGDVMVHKSQIPAQYDEATGAYNFDNNFQYIKKYTEKADAALCNVETTFAGQPYTGYPVFSAPETLADALRDAGFDVAITSNNHMMDKGTSGMKRTVEVLRAAGLPVTGSRLAADEPRYVIYDMDGIKLGVVAYTYTTLSGGRVLVNGNTISDEAASLINRFSYDTVESDLAKVKEQVDLARTDGAEIVAVYYHWGEEYQKTANKWQHLIAEKTVEDMDVDIIFASHPHVLQEMEYIAQAVPAAPHEDETAAETGDADAAGAASGGGIEDDVSVTAAPEVTYKYVPVYYSLGNLISNQRTETGLPKATENGALAIVTASFEETTLDGVLTGRRLLCCEADAVPTWVDKYKSGGKDVYAVIPLDDELDNNDTLAASGHLARAKNAREDAYDSLGYDASRGDN